MKLTGDDSQELFVFAARTRTLDDGVPNRRSRKEKDEGQDQGLASAYWRIRKLWKILKHLAIDADRPRLFPHICGNLGPLADRCQGDLMKVRKSLRGMLWKIATKLSKFEARNFSWSK